MQTSLTILLTVGLMLSIAARSLRAEGEAAIVDSRRIWTQPTPMVSTDLVRFQDRWFCAIEGPLPRSARSVFHVISSSNEADWDTAARIESPADDGSLHDPGLVISADDQLMLAGVSVVPRSKTQSWYWTSPDGRDWGDARYLGEENFMHSGIWWHEGSAYTYGFGCICGIAQTVQIRSNRAAQYFAPHFEHTFSGFFPKAAALAFDGDQAVCLLSRSNGPNSDRSTLIGRSNAPYADWNWTWFGLQMSHPNLVRMPDGRIVAAVGLHEPRRRTSLCVLDRTTGELVEVLELPTRGRAIDVGLAAHDGHLWASCHLADAGEYHIHLVKIVLPAGQ